MGHSELWNDVQRHTNTPLNIVYLLSLGTATLSTPRQ